MAVDDDTRWVLYCDSDDDPEPEYEKQMGPGAWDRVMANLAR